MPVAWRAKRFGPKTTKAHWRLHFGLVKEGIAHLLNKYLHGKTRSWNVDVYIAPWLIIEVDGSSHVGKQLLKDQAKTRDLETAQPPFTVLRFRDPEIMRDLPRVLTHIKKVLNPP